MSVQLNENFAKDLYDHDSYEQRLHRKRSVEYIKQNLPNINSLDILDIGQKSPLSEAIEKSLNVKIDNTSGDLDFSFTAPKKQYDAIIYSHTIEHQFNPLYTLVEIYKLLKDDGVLFIMLPERGKILWDKGHYHEIDNYRFKELVERAGFKIIKKENHRPWRAPFFYLTGLRPFLRLFLEFNANYTLKKAAQVK
jgi:2-polyprenyl-3-methyl-5-hydroxy-6-metoxy-1,4-benzoquinol methylase